MNVAWLDGVSGGNPIQPCHIHFRENYYLSLVSWLCIGWLVLMTTVVAYLAWFYGLSWIEGSLAASTLFIQPLLGTLLAVFLLHESLTPYTIGGGLLIVINVYLITKQA